MIRSTRSLLGGSDVPQLLPNFDLLASGDEKVEVVGCFKDEDNGTPEAETAHLFALDERLAIKDRRRGGVDGLSEGPYGVSPARTDVGAQCLDMRQHDVE